MYGLLWRLIPGPKWFKALVCLALLAGVIVFLFKIGFPWFVDYMGINDITL